MLQNVCGRGSVASAKRMTSNEGKPVPFQPVPSMYSGPSWEKSEGELCAWKVPEAQS